MAKRKTTLKVIPFENRGGSYSYRVSGTIIGKRVQKNFATQAAAEAFLSELVGAANQEESYRVTTTLFPTDPLLREAESAYAKLTGAAPSASLLKAVEFYLAHNCTELVAMGAVDAVDDFAKERASRGNRQETIDVGTTVLKAFVRKAAMKTTAEMTLEKFREFAQDTAVAVRTRRDRRDLLCNWCEFLVARHAMIENLAVKLPRLEVEYAEPVILRLEQAKKLLEIAAAYPGHKGLPAGSMLPYFSICLLSGIRPDEATRLKPDWSDFTFEKGIITGFRPKTTRARTVVMLPSLQKILEHCKSKGLRPGFFSKSVFDRTRKQAGVFDSWPNDVLRHTYASHHYSVHGDIRFLEKNMGNSEEVLHRSYINQRVLADEGKALLEFVPEKLSVAGARSDLTTQMYDSFGN